MKKYILIISALLILAFLCSCARGNADNDAQADTEPEIKIIYPDPDGKRVVMLDAGHGFRDIGCDTELLDGVEAEVNLAITLLLKAELEERGVSVVLTHDGNTCPSAETIKALAKEAGVEYKEEDIIENDVFSAYERAIYVASVADSEAIDLFLSLHVNSVENKPDISRYELDYYKGNPYSTSLSVLANSIVEKLDNEAIIYEDEYENAFIVTKYGNHPSMLLEMGYATNERDSKNLNSPEWRENFAETLAESIADWIASFEEK